MLVCHTNQAAAAASAALMLLLVESLKGIAAAKLMPAHTTRKLLHVSAGPLYLATWALWPARPTTTTRLSVALIPAAMTLKFVATGLGFGSEAEVDLMARSGRRSELLRGPLSYGVVFTVASALGFRDRTAATALMALCFGDGLADLVGRRFGVRKLPWSSRKSWAGSLAFVASSVLAGLVTAQYFVVMGWSMVATVRLVLPLFAASTVAAIVESLPFEDVDNLTAPAAFAAAFHLLTR